MSIIHDALKKIEKEDPNETQAPPLYAEAPPASPSQTPVEQPPTGQQQPKIRRSWHLPYPSFRKNLLGVDIGSSSIKIVKLRQTGGMCHLVRAAYAPLLFGADTKTVAATLKALLKEQGIAKSLAASTIAAKSLTFSHITLPKMPEEDLREAVRWEVKKGLDFGDNAVIDFTVNDESTEGGKTTLSILAFAVRKDEIYGHVELLKEASLIPGAIDVCPMSLLSAFDYNYGWEKNKKYAVIDMGASKATLAILSNGSLRFTRSIPLAGNDITKTIQDADNLDFNTAEQQKIRYASDPNNAPASIVNAVATFTDRLSTELRRSFNYYQAQLREGLVDQILLSGGCAAIKEISESIENNLGIPASVYDVTRKAKVKGNITRHTEMPGISPIFAEAFGLALRKEGE